MGRYGRRGRERNSRQRDRRADRDRAASTAIRLENLPFGGTNMSDNAREGLHETLLDIAEQKALLMSGAFSA